MRCSVGPEWIHSSVELLPPTLAYSFLRPASSLFTLHSMLHCTRDASCAAQMEEGDHCRLTRNVEGVSVSRCTVSVDTSATMLPTRVEYEGVMPSSFIVSVGGRFFFPPSLVESVLQPTSIQLFAGSTPIHRFVIIEAGKSFAITVAVNPSTGVRLQLTPPPPDSVFVNATAIVGVIEQPMNTTFTITASNAAGSIATTLLVLVERSADTYLRCDAGRARVLVEEDKGFSGVMVPGDAAPVYTREGLVSVTAVCYTLDGCQLSLHHFDEGSMPLLSLHYQQEASTEISLSRVGFSVTPVVVEASAILHHPVPTLFWAVDGFCHTSFASLPAWLQPSSAVSLDGVAEELGEFVFSATFANSTHSVSLVFLVTVEDELFLPFNTTLLIIQTAVTPEDDLSIPLFTAPNDTLTVSYITLPSLPFSSFIQQVLLPPGFHNVTLLPSDLSRVDVFLHFLPIATRLPSQTLLWFLVQEAIRPEDFFLRFSLGTPPGSWTEPIYDDNFWDPTEPGELAFDASESFFFRKHFVLDARRSSTLGISLSLRSGALVYLNGELIWRVHAALGCSKGCEPVGVDPFSTLRHFEMTLVSRLREDDNVVAIQLVPFAHCTHPLYLSMALFPVAAPVVVSTPTTAITASFSVTPVRPRALPHA